MAKYLILLIEDNAEIRENMAEILELAQYEVITAKNGKEGVEMALTHNPALILCDIIMPILDGYGVLHTLQKRKALQNVPFVFLTAKSERSELRKGMELGADDYITKPFNATELLSAIESRLKRVNQEKGSRNGFSQLLHTETGREGMDVFIKGRPSSIFRRKQIVYTPLNQAHRMYYVKQGKLKAFLTNADGKEFITNLYVQGDFFGYIEILDNTVHHDTVEVIEDAELALISREEFETIVYARPELTRKFITMLAASVLEREKQLLSMAYDSLRMKVARAILLLGQKFNHGVEGQPIAMSRENLASIAGTAKESVIRTLSDFKNEGLIDIQASNIQIISAEGLKHILG